MARFGFNPNRGASGDLRAVKIDYGPLGDALNAIANAGAELSSEMSKPVSELLVSYVQDVFQHEGAVAGRSKWKGLADSTKAKRRGNTYVILEDTGILAGSITPFAEGPVAEAFTNVPYAGYHISEKPRHKIPLRDFTDIDFEGMQRDAADLLLAQLEANMMRNAG